MCGRYYVDDETAREIEKLVRDLDRRLKMERTGDVFPSQNAMILKGEGNHLAAEQMRWGFPGFEKGKLLINARAESALERPTFRESPWNALRSGRVYRIGAVLSLPGDFMSGIRARRSLPLSGKTNRFFSWQDAITGMKARRGS